MSFFADAYPRQIDVLTHISPFWRTYESNDTMVLTNSPKIRSYNDTVRQARIDTVFMPGGMSHLTYH